MFSKKQFLFFKVLIAAAIIVLLISTASAQVTTNASYAKALSALPLPQLQFNYSQEKVAVTGELSPGKNIQIIPFSLNNTSKKTVSIPLGSIIYHSDNVTTLFDESGQQVLQADDAKAEVIHTFRGDQMATFVHEVPNNSVIVDNGNTLHIIYNNSRVLAIIYNNPDASFIPESSQTCYGLPYNSQWIEGAEAPISSSSVSQFIAEWNVPTSPTRTFVTDPVTIWNGLYSCADGNPNTTLIQPVLEWNYDSTRGTWTMSTWYVWNNLTLVQENKPLAFIHSPRVNRSVFSGDNIQGNIQLNTLGYDAIGSITDLGSVGYGSSTLQLTHNNVPTPMSSQNLYAQIVLEGATVNGIIRQNNANYLPGPVTFKNFVLTDQDGYNLIPSTPMTSFVNPYWKNPSNFSDSQNLTVYNRWPLDITLVNNPNRIAPPVASFQGSPISGIGSDYVSFHDQSIGAPFLWHWDFGDGSTSTDENPFHYYTYPGAFTVNLTVWSAGGINSLAESAYIIVSPTTVSSFTATPRTGTSPLAVTFTDTSTGNRTSWNWTFGDGNMTNSTVQNPIHKYWSGGTYNVSLRVNGTGGSNTTTMPGYITVTLPPPPTAVFTSNVTDGFKSLRVQFTDKSTDLPTTWNWSFGDNTSNATIQNPVHTYTANGTYNVSLTVRNAYGSNATIAWNYIKVGGIRDKLGVYSNGTWYLDANGNGVYDGSTIDRAYTFGVPGNVSVTGDWNGDNKTEIGVTNSVDWSLDTNGNGIWDGPTTDQQGYFGIVGYTPVIGDWNGDKKAEIGVANNGTWYLDYNRDGRWNGSTIDRAYTFGIPGNVSVTGDWNGDGKTEIGVTNSVDWSLDTNGNGTWDGPTVDQQGYFGIAGYIPVVGDWNGDGKTEIGVTNSVDWYLDMDRNGRWNATVDKHCYLATASGTPVVGDWNGDGKTEVGITNSVDWYLDYNGNGLWDGVAVDKLGYFGITGFTPVVGKWH